jgi:predicted GIY-YIG superfamily endonuclease
MTNVPTITWAGQSGASYKYWVYPFDIPFDPKPGNYIFAGQSGPGRWHALYIGQTSDLSERFDTHHAMAEAKRRGATHIHAHVNGDEKARLAEEADLRQRWKPPCKG